MRPRKNETKKVKGRQVSVPADMLPFWNYLASDGGPGVSETVIEALKFHPEYETFLKGKK